MTKGGCPRLQPIEDRPGAGRITESMVYGGQLDPDAGVAGGVHSGEIQGPLEGGPGLIQSAHGAQHFALEQQSRGVGWGEPLGRGRFCQSGFQSIGALVPSGEGHVVAAGIGRIQLHGLSQIFQSCRAVVAKVLVDEAA
jgi:hypothetical protein